VLYVQGMKVDDDLIKRTSPGFWGHCEFFTVGSQWGRLLGWSVPEARQNAEMATWPPELALPHPQPY
jgi:hypothetical protein